MRRNRDGEQQRTSGMNLFPIVNLATLLVPVVLMGSQALVVRWLDARTMPLENPGDAELRPVVPVVEVSFEGFRILGAEDVLAGPGGRPSVPCVADRCTDPGAYDYARLRRLLGHVKAAYPWADEVRVVVVDEVGVEVLARAMDAARDDGEREMFPRVRLTER